MKENTPLQIQTMALSLFATPFFDGFGSQSSLFEFPRLSHESVMSRGMGAVDLTETDEHYKVTMDAPGMSQSDIKVQVRDGNVLTISGERSSQREEGDSNYYERTFGTFSRSFRLYDNADINALTAQMDNGVLTVSIPKREPDPPSVVDVQVTSSSPAPALDASNL